jgi:hypothetical protein
MEAADGYAGFIAFAARGKDTRAFKERMKKILRTVSLVLRYPGLGVKKEDTDDYWCSVFAQGLCTKYMNEWDVDRWGQAYPGSVDICLWMLSALSMSFVMLAWAWESLETTTSLGTLPNFSAVTFIFGSRRKTMRDGQRLSTFSLNVYQRPINYLHTENGDKCGE